MQLFKVLRDDPNLGTGRLDAAHRWCLPGVICPQCGSTWAAVGLEYPAIDLSFLPNEREYRQPRPVPFNEFARLCRQVAELMGPEALLRPGTDFGPLVGKGKGRFVADFAWVNLWTLLVTKEGLAWLKDRVPNLNGVPTQLTFRSDERPTLLELQLEPQGELILPPVSNAAHPCNVCGRDPRPLPEQLVISRSSIPENLYLFRVRNFTTVVLATDRFVKAVGDLGLVGLRFEPISVL